MNEKTTVGFDNSLPFEMERARRRRAGAQGAQSDVFELRESVRADNPMTDNGLQYHLHTKQGDIASYCLFVGDPGRAEMIAREFLTDAHLMGDHRGLKSFTGTYGDLRVSVVTTGMGGASTGIVMLEAVRCGARRIIRIGSCSALQPEIALGSPIVVTGAVRLEGASKNWALIEYPAMADFRVLNAFYSVSRQKKTKEDSVHFGIEATTDCFNEGQARPDDGKYTPPRLLAQHRELIAAKVACYSMEAAAMFVWASTHGHLYEGGVWVGAVNAVYGNRIQNTFDSDEGRLASDQRAAEMGIKTLRCLDDKFPISGAKALRLDGWGCEF